MISAALTTLLVWMLCGPAEAGKPDSEPDDDATAVVESEPGGAVIEFDWPDRRKNREGRRRHLVLPPLRADVRTPFRPDLGPGLSLAFGTQLLRSGRTTFDSDISFTSGRQILMAGPFRSQFAFSWTGIAQRELGPWLSVGPLIGIDYRWFRQQWTNIDSAWVPLGGLQINSTLLGARRWGLSLGARVTVDAVRTRFVRETAEIVDLTPIEGQLGMRVLFGYGRDGRDRRKGQEKPQ